MNKKKNLENKKADLARGKISTQTIKRLLSYVYEYKIRFVFVMICIVLSAIASVASSLFLQTLIDDYIAPLLLDSNPVFTGLLKTLTAMACIYLSGIAATLCYNRIMVTVAQGILKKIRNQAFAHMQTLPIKYFDTNTYGDVMSYFTNDIDTLRQMLAQSIPQVFSSIITIGAVFCAMLITSVWLTIFVIIFVVIMLKITKVIASKSSTFFTKQQKCMGDITGYIEEIISGQKVVKVFSYEEKAKAAFYQKNDDLCSSATEANKFANILMPIMSNLGYLLYVLIAVVGGALAIAHVPNLSLSGQNVLTLGAIATFLQLSRSFIMPISQVSQQLNLVVMALAGANRIFGLLDEESETDDGYVTLVNVKKDQNEISLDHTSVLLGMQHNKSEALIIESTERTGSWAWKHPHQDGTITYTPLKGEVCFYDVDFCYEENKTVLSQVTLYAKKGQKIAFVGATGAGKTTITNLINRFYDIADGKIRYDGININKIKKSDLRRSLGVVLQDTNLFTGTVLENIRYGQLDASDEECINAAKRVSADSFISRLSEGYQTVLSGDGSGLSQGQRQLLSIARVAVADPPVMILDEATSSIDTRTEAIVQQGMDALMEGRTVFVIAHRLSTVKNSDVIMVLEKGRIIERGDHKRLLQEKGKYYQLYTGAFELD